MLQPTQPPGLTGHANDSNDALILRLAQYCFKRAESEDELEQVHRLNYQTFVRELHQYEDAGSDHLVDKFHHKNQYLVALRNGRVVGMLAVHDHPPFSVADRLSDPTVLARLGPRLLEVRLLAIQPGERHRIVFAGLMWAVYEYARRAGYTHLIASGVTDRLELYERLGFRALGPAVPCGHAAFVPMALALDAFPDEIRRDIVRWERRLAGDACARADT